MTGKWVRKPDESISDSLPVVATSSADYDTLYADYACVTARYIGVLQGDRLGLLYAPPSGALERM